MDPSQYGHFYDGDSYLVLKIQEGENGVYLLSIIILLWVICLRVDIRNNVFNCGVKEGLSSFKS